MTEYVIVLLTRDDLVIASRTLERNPDNFKAQELNCSDNLKF
jgi:hypothetical protein